MARCLMCRWNGPHQILACSNMSGQTLLALCVALVFASCSQGAEVVIIRKPLSVLLVDGQNNHAWKITTPIMQQYYEACDRFTVDVRSSPPQKHDMSTFRPQFSQYDVVVSNYNGDPWPKATEQEFQAYVHSGGGFVAVHAAGNSFPDWPEYNQIIGLGGWNGRNQNSGPYVYFRDDKLVRDESQGSGGGHGSQHEFVVKHRDTDHPITRGLPPTWMHTKDELYERLRGPAKEMQVLATAFADPEQNGSGRDEPMLMTIQYGQGRVFHTTLGHADYSMHCTGFRTTLLRGTEWAATGEVTQAVPKDFPTADESRSRE